MAEKKVETKAAPKKSTPKKVVAKVATSKVVETKKVPTKKAVSTKSTVSVTLIKSLSFCNPYITIIDTNSYFLKVVCCQKCKMTFHNNLLKTGAMIPEELPRKRSV